MAANRGRIAAARALIGVDAGEYVEDVLARAAPDAGSDRKLAWFLALGVLERRAHLDAALRDHLRQPLGGLDPEVRAALRLGAFELLYARTKRHAAVNEAVEVTKALGLGRAKGLVNAVLRKVEEPTGLSRAEELDHPAWLVARWDQRYGEGVTTAWCERNNEPAVLFAVARRDSEALAVSWRTEGLQPEPVRLHGEVLPGVLRVGEATGAIFHLPGFDEGLFWIQDAAAVAVADLLGAGQGDRVLDACAAPGGKTFRLAAAGAAVTAVDADPERLETLGESLERLDLQADVRVHDWTEGPHPELGEFDGVLVDAPCTALGLLRRHPGIRWRRQLVDVLRAPEHQQRILEGAAAHVAPGGRLVYAVCSPEPEEGEQVVASFLEAQPGFRSEGVWASAPPEHDEDAFQAFVLVREGVA